METDMKYKYKKNHNILYQMTNNNANPIISTEKAIRKYLDKKLQELEKNKPDLSWEQFNTELSVERGVFSAKTILDLITHQGMKTTEKYIRRIKAAWKKDQEAKYNNIIPIMDEIYTIPKEFSYVKHGLLDEAQKLGEQLFSMAEKLKNNKELSQAKYLCELSLKFWEENPDFWNLYGQIHEQKGDLKQAIIAYEKCVEIAPMGTYTSNLTRFYENNLDKLIELWKNCAENFEEEQAYVNLGDCYIRKGDVNLAIEAYQHALVKAPYPENIPIWFKLGLVCANNQLYDMAKDIANKLKDLDLSKSYFISVKIFISKKEYNEARDLMIKYVGLNNNNTEARYMLSVLYARTSQVKEAVDTLNLLFNLDKKYLDKVKKDDDYIQVRLALAQSYIEEKSYKSALDIINETLKIDPKHERGLSKKAWCLACLKNWDEALQLLDIVVSINPEYYLYWIDKGLCELEVNNKEKGLKSLKFALALNQELTLFELNVILDEGYPYDGKIYDLINEIFKNPSKFVLSNE